jgi:hypothetical protein
MPMPRRCPYTAGSEADWDAKWREVRIPKKSRSLILPKKHPLKINLRSS